MAKTKPEAEPIQAPEAAQEFPQSLEEFCRELSLTERRHALIASFFYTENAAGRVKDTASAYQKRYSEHLTTPAR
ncbi:hypothetical protein VPZ60_004276 [Salmonella enterica]|nr:hypothetical protein [Salmonella enterica]